MQSIKCSKWKSSQNWHICVLLILSIMQNPSQSIICMLEFSLHLLHNVYNLKCLTFTSNENDNLLVRIGIITKLNSFLVLRVVIIIPRSLDNCLWRISFLFVAYHVLEYILHLYYICALTKIGALTIRQSELLLYFQYAWKRYCYQSFQLVYYSIILSYRLFVCVIQQDRVV